MKDFGYDVSELHRRRSDLRHACRFRRAGRRGPPPRPQGDHRPGAVAHLRPASLVQGEPRRAATNAKADWYVWADPQARRHAAQQLAVDLRRLGLGMGHAPPPVLLAQFPRPSSPTSTSTTAQVQDALLDDGAILARSAASTASASTPSTSTSTRRALKSNPPADDRDAPEALGRQPLRLCRSTSTTRASRRTWRSSALPRAARPLSGATTRSARSATARAALKTMAAYTSGGDKLHMCYTFDFLGPTFIGALFPRARSKPSRRSSSDGWPCWAFSNHDVIRHVSRWGATHEPRPRWRGLPSRILLSLRGSVCLYQGEELGLTEADARLRGSGRSLRHPLLARIQGPRRLPHADGVGSERAERRLLDGQALAAGAGRASGPAVERGDRRRRARCWRTTGGFSPSAAPIRRCATGAIRFLDAPEDVLAFVRAGRAARRSSACSISAGARARVTAAGGGDAARRPSDSAHGWKRTRAA